MDKSRVRTILIGVYLFLLFFSHVYEIDACDDVVANPVKPRQADVMTAIERGKLAASFDISSVCESIILLLFLLGVESRVLCTVLLVFAIAVRARHVGVGQCTPNDTACCSALECYKFPACTAPPFLSTQTDWNLRANYCPMPYFYYKDTNARLACTTLANTPDMASCYRYGCSEQHTPYTYYSNRVGLGVLTAIVFLSM